MKLSFVITNDKASYVSKEDSICLFSIVKEVAFNEQQIKPCVPLIRFSNNLRNHVIACLQLLETLPYCYKCSHTAFNLPF